jgi:DNA repair exonuclease SbcCD nuclease subunit
MIFAARAFSPNKLWAILPYTDNNEEIIDFFNDLIINNVNPPYLFTHNVIVKPDNNEFLNAAFDKDDPALKKYKLIFSGHVHKPQQIGNVVYVGSMYQTDFGEADEQKRFCVLDPDTGIYESINFAYPELINVNGSEISEDKACDNYIKFKIKLSAKERAPNIRSIIENALVKGALDVKVVIERDKPIRKIRLTKEQIKSNTFENLVELYCNQHKLNYDDIIDYSKLLMANV